MEKIIHEQYATRQTIGELGEIGVHVKHARGVEDDSSNAMLNANYTKFESTHAMLLDRHYISKAYDIVQDPQPSKRFEIAVHDHSVYKSDAVDQRFHTIRLGLYCHLAHKIVQHHHNTDTLNNAASNHNHNTRISSRFYSSHSVSPRQHNDSTGATRREDVSGFS